MSTPARGDAQEWVGGLRQAWQKCSTLVFSDLFPLDLQDLWISTDKMVAYREDTVIIAAMTAAADTLTARKAIAVFLGTVALAKF